MMGTRFLFPFIKIPLSNGLIFFAPLDGIDLMSSVRRKQDEWKGTMEKDRNEKYQKGIMSKIEILKNEIIVMQMNKC